MNTVTIKLKLKQIYSQWNETRGIYNAKIHQAIDDNGLFFVPMYHRVIDNQKDDPFNLGMCLTTRRFEQQLVFIKEYFDVWPLENVIDAVSKAQALPRNLACITFDDGYHDNLALAQPLLEKHNMPWTLFVTTGQFGEPVSYWWDRVIECFHKTTKNQLSSYLIGEPEERQITISSFTQKRQALEKCLSFLWSQHISCAEKHIALLQDELNIKNNYPTKRLSADDLHQLKKKNVNIGAHTVRHPNMVTLSSKEVNDELIESKQFLEDILGRPVNHFAYPGGHNNSAIQQAVQEAGYCCALATTRGLNLNGIKNYGVERVGMPDSTVAHLKHGISSLLHSG